MGKNDKIIQIIVATTITTVVLFYFSFLVLLPKLINSPQTVTKIEKFLSNKIGFNIKFEEFKYVSNPNLSFELYLKKIIVTKNKEEKIIDIDKFNYRASIFNIKRGKLNIKYLFADMNIARKYLHLNRTKKSKFNISNLPAINIKSGKVIFTKNTYAEIKYMKSRKDFGEMTINILAHVINPYTKNPVTIGEKGSIKCKHKLRFDNFSIKFGDSEIFLSGNKDFSIKGKGLPAKQLKEGFLYIYKLKHPDKKNFIENFTDFKGTMDVDLIVNEKGFWGKCITRKLGANFSNLKIPVYLPETTFYFNKRTVKADTQGLFGPEPVRTDVSITGVATDNLEVLGTVESVFTNNIVKKYYPNVAIQGQTPAKVTYNIHKEIVDVYYYLTIPKQNNLLSVWGNIDNTDRTRKITMHTQKKDTPIVIKEFEYCAGQNEKCQKLLFGDGLIDKLNGKYTLYNLNVKSNGEIPVNYIKSFLRDYVKNGTFDADVKLDFMKKSMLGTMNLYNISHDNFLFLKNTSLNVNKNKIILNTNGTFYSSPIAASVIANNKFENNKIVINSIDMHLNSLFLQRGTLESIPKTFKNKPKIAKPKLNKKKKPDIEIEQGRVVVDRIYGKKFDVRNVNFQGGLKNNIANFIIPKAEYAKGLLSAKGIYNVKEHSSNIDFYASDIDSNEVATNMFKLPDQIEGIAFATLHIITKNKFNDIKAKATFAIDDGYLPKIGNKEFIIKKSKNDKKTSKFSKIFGVNVKLTLSKITNIDFSKPKTFYSNLYGSFNIDNDNVKDVKIFSRSEYIGLYIEGNYNIETENGDINIFGKRNKTAAKKIRVFKIPINLIYRIVFKPEHSAEYYEDKVKLIPEIKASIVDDIGIFRVSVKGNFNKSEKLNIELKDIR